MICVIVQARMNSTRLPGKVVLPLTAQYSVIQLMLARLKYVRYPIKIVVAITNNPQDEEILYQIENFDVEVFRGDEHDVLSRYYLAAQHYNAKTIVRLTADCPLYAPELLDEMLVTYFNKNIERYDYFSNTQDRTFPRGLDTEIITIAALRKAYLNAKQNYEREHVTSYIYQHPDEFTIGQYQQTENLSKYRLTIDTVEDLNLIKELCRDIIAPDKMTISQIIECLQKKPELLALNAHIEQKRL